MRSLTDLRQIVGRDHVLVDADQRAGYERDWTGRYGGPSIAVVRPADAVQVSQVLQWCAANDVTVVPQGGNTGLVGGGVPNRAGQIVLSTSRMTEVGAVDVAAGQVTVGAGVTIAGWRQAARAAGMDIPVDFAARDSATVGGAIATNAGGSRVVRFGTMRRQVMGIQAVLADGSVVGSLAGLPKESAGLHWPSLICGSEGTLAIITAARLRLVPHFAHTATAFASVASIGAAVELLARARTVAPHLDSIELMFPEAVALAAAHLGRTPPVQVAPDGCAVIIECAAHDEPLDELVAVLDGADGICGTALAADTAGREAIVAFRDRVTESIAAESTRVGTPVLKLDVAVPSDQLGQLLEVARTAAARDGSRLVPFGHLAEGNVHLNVIGARHPEAITDEVLGAVARLGGTISAEHGIGVAKASYLSLIRSPGELAAQQAIAHALDPTSLLNPGVLGT